MAFRHNRKGSVLIIVLFVLAAATYLMMESGKFLRIDYEGAAFQRTNAVGGALLDSGMFIARELLVDDLRKNGNNADHLYEDWAEAGTFFTEISKQLESGEIEGGISAEDGKINVNYLLSGSTGKALSAVFVRLVNGLLSAHGIEGTGADYLESIKVWLGAKDKTQDAAWYAVQDPAYSPRKGPLLSLSELLLIRWRGVSNEDKRRVLYGADGIPGLIEFVTIWGNGLINMNTASRNLVGAICPTAIVREEFVQAVETYRRQPENLFAGQWYKDIAVMVGVDMEQFPQNILTVKSSIFRVALIAKVGAGVVRSTSVVRRTTNSCVVLFENIH